MANKLNVVVLTPVKEVLRGSADSVIAPSALGQVGILPDHRPLLADLKAGVVEVLCEGTLEKLAISEGFIEVDNNNVRILTESAEFAADIDRAAAERAIVDAEQHLKKLAPVDEAYASELLKLDHNQARLRVFAS